MTLENVPDPAPPRQPFEWVPFITVTEGNKAFATVTVSPNYLPLSGHFEDNPLLPGYMMLHWFMELADCLMQPDAKRWEIVSIKWLKPIRPEQKLMLEAYWNGIRVEARCMVNGELGASADLRPL